MFAPNLYTVRKMTMKFLMEHGCDVTLSRQEERQFNIQQQDNLLFRQIRDITGNHSKFNPYVIFVDCNGGKSRKEELSELVCGGFSLSGKRFVVGERSASMVRLGILSFIDSEIIDAVNQRITMGVTFDKVVLSKYTAYRGLMFSSCHCLEGYTPKIIIVPDYYRVIPNQRIKYAYDKTSDFVDKEGNQRTWTQKAIGEDVRDIEINVFDGCGIHHPQISEEAQKLLSSKTRLTSVVWRAPYIKGVTHEIDYQSYFRECGIEIIRDVWGVPHSVDEPMIIMTESMYKGKSYFQTFGDERDWQTYWDRFRKFNHCIGIAKWNFSSEKEPVYTRANYQILQDLQLPYEDFAPLASKSIEWIERIIDGDMLYTYCFLGLLADNHKPQNAYTKAILKNPEMLKEYGVRSYLISLLEKHKDEMKCGKLWLKSCFKFLAPDLKMLLEHIGGQEVKGCLESDEFFSFDARHVYEGEHLIERNPHICKSEHVVLKGTDNEFLSRYCKGLPNICMINGKSIVAQRLNGADYDGDLVLLVDDKRMMAGVDRHANVVIDVDDKITALAEEDNADNRLALILRTMNSLIGETSNCATGYHNKVPKTQEQREKYDSYIDLLSIINGKAIDYAKTGILYNIPRNIAKYSKPLPSFMKYASNYYRRQKKLSHAPSNLNRLCKEIEKWEKGFRYKRTFKDFNYNIMTDPSIPLNEERFAAIDKLFAEFCKEMVQLGKDQFSIRQEYRNFDINWSYYYETYKNKCRKACPNPKELANYAVLLCYEKYPNRNKKFIWRVASEGVLENLRQVPMLLPKLDPDGTHEYLGKKYSFQPLEAKE